MNNPFSISDDKLKFLLKSYSEWIKNSSKEEDKNYADVQEQLTQDLKDTLLNKKYLGEISKDQLTKEIFAYSRKLEGPAFIRLGKLRISNNTEKIKETLLYLIDSPDDPIKKASEILSGKYQISIFAKAFWTPIFQAQYPKILPNWNNKTERFLKIAGVNLKTTRMTIEEKYRLLSSAFVYLTQLDPDQDFYTLNHLMHYGTMVEEGKKIMAELLGSDTPPSASFFEYLIKFLNQAKSNKLNTSEYPNEYLNCKVKIGFGQGLPAKIPWMAFLKGNNRVSEGIYPVYLYYKNRQKLILSYGVSESNAPTENWKNTDALEIIGHYFQEHFQASPGHYGNSFIFKAYDVEDMNKLNPEEIDKDLNQIIDEYKNQVSNKNLLQTEKNSAYWRIIEPLDTHEDSVWPGCKENKLIAIGYEDNIGTDVQKMRDEMKIGDWVIAYLEKGRVGGIGTIIGDYEDYLDTKPQNENYFQGKFWRRRKVRWDYLPENKKYWQLPAPYSESMPGVRQTIFKLTKDQFDEIMSLIGISQPPLGITKVEILKEIFLEEEKFDQVIDLLENSNKKQIILQGPPGTGKTFIGQRIALFLAQSEDRVETIQFHPSYSYEDFIEGYRPTKNKGFELEEGIFKQFCLKARGDPQNKYVLIIDEINRGNLAKIFGELLYLLEYRKEEVKLTYSKELFSIPENIYIIGTMNTADRSLAIMDYALRRRFYFLTLTCQTQRLASWLRENGSQYNVEDLISKLEALNRGIGEEMRSSDFAIGHSYFMKENLNSRVLKNIITFEVRPLLEEYFYDRPEKALELVKIFGDYAK